MGLAALEEVFHRELATIRATIPIAAARPGPPLAPAAPRRFAALRPKAVEQQSEGKSRDGNCLQTRNSTLSPKGIQAESTALLGFCHELSGSRGSAGSISMRSPRR